VKTYQVTNDFIDKETGEEVKAGATFEADDERAERLRAAGVIGKEVRPGENANDPDSPLTAKEFAALSADEQKAELDKRQIEGEAGNAKERIALYEGYLQRQGSGENQ